MSSSVSSSQKKLTLNSPPANGLASQSTQPSTQQPRPVCTWSVHAPQPGPSLLPRSGHTLTASANAAGELLLFGGGQRGRTSSDVYVFSTRDFSTTLLRTSGRVPSPRHAHGAALIGTTLLICGGKTGGKDQNELNDDSVYLLNLVSREWTRVVVDGPGPCGHSYHTTTMVGSKLFVFGGEISKKEIINDMWTLDLNCLTSQPLWESCEPTPGNEKPPPRTAHVSATTEDRIIIFGGGGDQRCYNDTWSFDFSTRKWTELQCTGSIPSPRVRHAAVLVDDVMYVFGGFSTDEGYLDDLYALQLTTQRWFKIHNVGTSPHRRWDHAMASVGTRIFVLGGYSNDAREDELSLIHVFDTKHIKYPEPERNTVNPNEKTIQLTWKLSTGPPTQEQPQHRKYSSSEARGASRPQNANLVVSGGPASLQITQERNPSPNVRPLELTGVNSKARHVPGDDVSEGSTECHAKFVAPETEGVTRSELERQLSALLATQTERDQLIARQTDELAKKSVLLEQAEANSKRAGLELREHANRLLMQTSLMEQRDVELVNMQAKLDELVVSRDQQIGQYEKELTNVRVKLEAKESELKAVRLRLMDAEKRSTSLDELAVSRDQQVGQYEKELTNVRAKFEVKESELEAVRLRLTEAEKELTKSKADADTLRAQAATSSVDRDVDQVTRRLLERMRTIEAEVASKRWNEKSVEEMECRNEG